MPYPRTPCFVALSRRVVARAGALTLASLAVTAGAACRPAAADTRPNLVANPSLELDADHNGVPDGFEPAGYGANTASWTRVAAARSGAVAERLTVSSYGSGDRKLLATVTAGLVAGHRYSLSVYRTADVTTYPVVFTRQGGGAWRYWTTGASAGASAAWTPVTVTTPALPAGVTAVAFGLAVKSTGTVTTDDYAATDLDATAPVPTTAAPPAPTTAAPLAPTPTTEAPAPAPSTTPAAGSLFHDDFNRPDGLETNEFAFWNQGLPSAVASPNWEMDSGSFFRRGDAGYSGRPDAVAPNATSSNGNHSGIFRLKTRRMDFGDVEVSLRLRNMGLTTTSETPATDWDGVHVWLRYQSEAHLYYASINRRDDTIVIKKKVPGGPSNGGTYTAVASGRLPVVYGRWLDVKASVGTNADGSVTIRLYADGRLVLEGTDVNVGGVPPIRAAGAVGVRGDNAEIYVDDFDVRPLAR